MTTLTEGRHAGGFIASEAESHRSRSVLTLVTGQVVKAGQVLGLVAGTAPASFTVVAAARPGNTGNGAITMANPATGAGVMAGTYLAVCTAVAANGGTFKVTAPDGSVVANATVGTPFSNVVKFTIADGATDFALGDSVAITVDMTADAVASDCAAFAPAAVDGTQIAAAIAFDNADATVGPVPIVVMARDCQVVGDDLVWPAAIDPADQTAGIRQLAARGVIVR
ncbi:MAG: head decoration protein [Reyranella sp.]|uniref:head decoration protein n=1 Tax=Reyranella sp. TaxID=1929291 RepID=UPI0025D490CE|nr:head decoration protein [Reyranella sp.]MBR2819836.1 head decoration protein [Reyranella sp.]